MAQKVNVGIVGYGLSAKYFQLPFITTVPALNVYAILQRSAPPPSSDNPAPGSHCTIDFPDAKHYRTEDEFFGDESIDLVVLAVGPALHAPMAKKALLSGKNGM